MFSHLFIKNSPLVGLAIYHNQLNLVKVRRVAKQQLCVEAFATIALPPGWCAEGKINQMDVVVDALKKLVQLTHAKHCYAVLGLPSAYVINKSIKLPAFLTELEQEVEITNNLAHYLPGLQETLNFDYAPLTEGLAEDFLLVAARAEFVQAWLAFAQLAKLKVRVVDVMSYAFLRVVCFILQYSSLPEVIAILEIDATIAQLIFLRQGKIIFTHQFFFAQPREEMTAIKSAWQLFATVQPQQVIKQIFLCGVNTDFSAWQTKIQNELATPVLYLNPFPYVKLSPALSYAKIADPSFALNAAFGLTLRSYPRW